MAKWLGVMIMVVAGCASDPLAADLGEVEGVLEIGPQGGFHLWLDVAVSGADDPATLTVSTMDTNEPVMTTRVNDTSDGYAAIVCPAPPDMNLVDRQVRLELVVRGDAGELVRDERVVTLRCPTDHPDVLNTCRRICDRRVE